MDTPLRQQFGDIDIYLFDQLLRENITPGMRVLDAGCGYGRNLVYMMRNNYNVAGVDISASAIDRVKGIAAGLAPSIPAENFRTEPVQQMSFPDGTFDVVVSCAVLHFAESQEMFDAMVREMWRVLKPGGLFFARLASSIGIEDRVRLLENGLYAIPDGSIRYLVDESMLITMTRNLGGDLVDPIKTVNVQNLRCMSTWCVRKQVSS